jgi:hypothetical protein
MSNAKLSALTVTSIVVALILICVIMYYSTKRRDVSRSNTEEAEGEWEAYVDLSHYSDMCHWCESSPHSFAGSSQGCDGCARAKLMRLMT